MRILAYHKNGSKKILKEEKDPKKMTSFLLLVLMSFQVGSKGFPNRTFLRKTSHRKNGVLKTKKIVKILQSVSRI